MVDMAHFAGLVAAGLHPSPVRTHVVTTTVHKTLGGARGGMILCTEEHAKKHQLGGLPGPAGRPARARHRRQGGGVQARGDRHVQRAPGAHARRRKAVADALLGAGHGVNVLTGGTDVHLVLVDLRESELDGQQAEDRLHEIGITVNRNAVPFDPRPPVVSCGLRMGTPALATRGLGGEEFAEVGEIIAATLTPGFESQRADLAERVSAIAERHPLYAHLSAAAAV